MTGRSAAFALSALAALLAAPAADALTVTQREYQRGYRDCSTGNFDPTRRSKAYDRGCRAAQNFNSGTRRLRRPTPSAPQASPPGLAPTPGAGSPQTPPPSAPVPKG